MNLNNFEVKLLAVIGKIGKSELALRIKMTRSTLDRKIKSPGKWKLEEAEKVESIYNECFK